MSTTAHGSGMPGLWTRALARTIAYKDLAKIDIFDDYLNVLLAWTLLSGDLAGDGRTIAILVLMLFMQVGLVTGACALDDIAGMRDGIDPYNYAQSGKQRSRKRKPLLEGRLTERQAMRYAVIAVAVGIGSLLGAYAVAGFEPWWILPAFAALAFGVVGYSWGPKLSYIGGQEIVVVLGYATTLAITYGMVTGEVTWTVVLEGALLGIWLMQLTAFANVHDREGDRRADRVTMAVRLDERVNRLYLIGLFVLGWVVLVVGIATGELPSELAIAGLPSLAVQLMALRAGIVRGDHLRARGLGIYVLRFGVFAMLAANLVAFH